MFGQILFSVYYVQFNGRSARILRAATKRGEGKLELFAGILWRLFRKHVRVRIEMTERSQGLQRIVLLQQIHAFLFLRRIGAFNSARIYLWFIALGVVLHSPLLSRCISMTVKLNRG